MVVNNRKIVTKKHEKTHNKQNIIKKLKNIKNFEKMLDLKMKRWYYNKCTKEISENAHKSKKTAKLILYFLH